MIKTSKALLDKIREMAASLRPPSDPQHAQDWMARSARSMTINEAKVQQYAAQVQQYAARAQQYSRQIGGSTSRVTVMALLPKSLDLLDLAVWFNEIALSGVEACLCGGGYIIGGQRRMFGKVVHHDGGFILELERPIVIAVNCHVDGLGLFRNLGDAVPFIIAPMRLATPDLVAGAHLDIERCTFVMEPS